MMMTLYLVSKTSSAVVNSKINGRLTVGRVPSFLINLLWQQRQVAWMRSMFASWYQMWVKDSSLLYRLVNSRTQNIIIDYTHVKFTFWNLTDLMIKKTCRYGAVDRWGEWLGSLSRTCGLLMLVQAWRRGADAGQQQCRRGRHTTPRHRHRRRRNRRTATGTCQTRLRPEWVSEWLL